MQETTETDGRYYDRVVQRQRWNATSGRVGNWLRLAAKFKKYCAFGEDVASPSEKSIHLEKQQRLRHEVERDLRARWHVGLYEWVDDPRPIFWLIAETGSDWVLTDIVHLCRKLLATFVGPQTVIKISCLPHHCVVPRMKAFPVTDDAAHRFLTGKR